MSPRSSRPFVLTAVAIATVLGLGACGSDSDKASSTTGATAATSAPTTVATPTTVAATAVVETTEPESTEPATSEPTTASTDGGAATTVAPTTEQPTTTTAPDALSQLPGVSAVDVAVGGTDVTRPTFTWAPAANAASYQLVVQTADGVPLWAWTGAQTSVVLGGTERAADVEGPTLVGASRVRVYALDAAFTVVAVSGWVALPGS